MPKTKPGFKWRTPSKNCQTECCKPVASDRRPGFRKCSKLQNGSLVLYKEPTDIICRVKTCRSYGKAVLGFLAHLHQHRLSWKQHQSLPPATLQHQYVVTKTSSQWMRYRKPELCFVPGCKLEHRVYLTELVKHLRSEHSLSRTGYRKLLSNLSLDNFDGHCPAMIEEIEESAMEEAAKMMGTEYQPMILCLDPEDKTFPSLRLVHLQCAPGRYGLASFREDAIYLDMEDNTCNGSVSLIGRKRIMSQEHAKVFEQSLQKSTFWFYNLPEVSWLKYDCGVCKHVHTLEIVFVDGHNVHNVVETH